MLSWASTFALTPSKSARSKQSSWPRPGWSSASLAARSALSEVALGEEEAVASGAPPQAGRNARTAETARDVVTDFMVGTIHRRPTLESSGTSHHARQPWQRQTDDTAR